MTKKILLINPLVVLLLCFPLLAKAQDFEPTVEVMLDSAGTKKVLLTVEPPIADATHYCLIVNNQEKLKQCVRAVAGQKEYDITSLFPDVTANDKVTVESAIIPEVKAATVEKPAQTQGVAAKLEVTTSNDGKPQAFLVITNPVTEATHYCVTVNNDDKTKNCIPAVIGQTKYDITKYYPTVSARDILTVQAATIAKTSDKTSQTLGDPVTATNTGVIKQQTEFGPIANLAEYAQNIMGYAVPVAIGLAIIMTIYAGITLMLSQGSPDRVKDAQEIIQGAILGLVVIILSRFLVNFLLIPTDSEPAATTKSVINVPK